MQNLLLDGAYLWSTLPCRRSWGKLSSSSSSPAEHHGATVGHVVNAPAASVDTESVNTETPIPQGRVDVKVVLDIPHGRAQQRTRECPCRRPSKQSSSAPEQLIGVSMPQAVEEIAESSKEQILDLLSPPCFRGEWGG